MTSRSSASSRVCLVAPYPPPYGGIARWTQIITKRAAQTREVDLRLVNTALRLRTIHDVARWKRLPTGIIHGAVILLEVAWNLLLGCKTFHLTTSGEVAIYRDIVMLHLARLFGASVVYHLRFGRIPELAAAQTREWQLLTKALGLATTVIAIDQRTESTLRAHFPGLDLRFIPNCADLESLPAPALTASESKTVLYLGWVKPAKGMHELLQAWEQLPEFQDWRLIIVGPYEAAFHQELSERYPLGRVEFTGNLSHAESMSHMAQAAIFVLPSHTEGFPNVILEAMALGRPILTTTVGAIPEMLQDGCGLLVPPQDSDALRTALESLLVDKELRNRLGEAALNRMRNHYTIEVVFEKLVALWRETMR